MRYLLILFFILNASSLALAQEPVIAVEKKALLDKEPDVAAIEADPRAKVIDEVNANQGEPQNIGVVLDSSGSMGAILDKNKTKMFFLKQVMKGFVREQWKLDNNIGVRVYGAKQKQRCDDIQLPIGYSDHSIGKLEKSLELMEPVGMTPIHRSLEMTVNEMKKMKGPKKILLVTDGEDTCAGDPCKTAERIKAEKLDITFYVIALGFSGPSDELNKLSCLGDVTTADDEQSFGDAVSQVSSRINNRTNLKVLSPNPESPVYLYSLKTGKPVLERVFYARSEQTVPPGRYEAVVGLKPLYKFQAFDIPPARKITLRVEGSGHVTINYFARHARAQLLDKNNKVITKFRSDEKVEAPSGKWKLRIYKDPFYEKIIPEFFVYPNGDHTTDLAGVGVIKVSYPSLEGVYVYDEENKLIDHGLTNSYLLLRTGTYAVHVNEKCTFGKVEVHDKKEVLVLPCGGK